jgi:hypothetical protein
VRAARAERRRQVGLWCWDPEETTGRLLKWENEPMADRPSVGSKSFQVARLTKVLL